MITNERQYRITKAEAERFRQALVHMQSEPSATDVHPRLVQAQRDALASQLHDLEGELQEYEALKRGDVKSIVLNSFDELATGLIKARIASGLSQKALADRLNLKEQQIQRYEADRYASASYQRLQDVAKAIGITIRKEILLPPSDSSLSEALASLERSGLSRDFVYSRLMPSTLAAEAEDPTRADKRSVYSALEAIVSRVYGWSRAELLAPGVLSAPTYAAEAARFKMPARRASGAVGIYSAYANYLANIVLEGGRSIPPGEVPLDANQMHAMIKARYGHISLAGVLRFAWDLGVPVLPLRDPGTFHGACWRYGGRNVIVLKQSVQLESRWLFDLLHELYHAGQCPEDLVREVIESDATSEKRRTSAEETGAGQYAGDVVLNGRAEALAKECVAAAKGSVERLKAVVPRVADREDVPLGGLANYLALRLSWQGINWWGAATNLQRDGGHAWEIARDVFLERFPFEIDSELDRQLLQRALQ